MNENKRREFLKTTIKGTLALGIAGSSFTALGEALPGDKIIPAPLKTGFNQQPLPYAYSALEDIIDATTMEIHYTKHAAGYSKNLKEAAAAEGVDGSKSVEDLLPAISKYSAKMRNNAGGHYNHEMFWKCMRPKQAENKPAGTLLAAIEKSFGTFTDFTTQFSNEGKSRFGSGWAWLYLDAGKNLKVGSTPNQDNPLMDVSDIKGTPVLGLDVWEHAYYLKYQNKRPDYITNWWNVVNWEYVQDKFDGRA